MAWSNPLVTPESGHRVHPTVGPPQRSGNGRDRWPAYNGAMTSLDLRWNDALLRAAAADALTSVEPAVDALAQALADLRDVLPPEHRAEGERAFMNAFGNAVWGAAHRR